MDTGHVHGVVIIVLTLLVMIEMIMKKMEINTDGTSGLHGVVEIPGAHSLRVHYKVPVVAFFVTNAAKIHVHQGFGGFST